MLSVFWLITTIRSFARQYFLPAKKLTIIDLTVIEVDILKQELHKKICSLSKFQITSVLEKKFNYHGMRDARPIWTSKANLLTNKLWDS